MYEKYKQFLHNESEAENDAIWHDELVFFQIDDAEKEVAYVENELGIQLPQDLRRFYNEIGYGFVCTNYDNLFNRLLSPIEIYDFYKGINEYENDERRGDCSLERNAIAFYEVSEDVFLTVKSDEQNQANIYYFDELVAESLMEFIDKMLEKPNYYLD